MSLKTYFLSSRRKCSIQQKPFIDTRRQLHKLHSEILPNNMPLESKQWDFHLLEKKDVTAVSKLVVLCIGENIMNVEGRKLFGFEEFLYPHMIAWGMNSRSGNRLTSPSLNLSTESFILAITYPNESDIIATAEIFLKQPDNKNMPSAFKNPFKSIIPKASLQPYICNVCVSPDYRRKGLGKMICKLSEEFVQIYWNKKSMYLHVDQINLKAIRMYEGMGYKSITPEESNKENKMIDYFYFSNSLVNQWHKKHEKNS